MKLCSLRFKNLNSLAGEWRVDFEAPEFSAGLFAITGPTSAGKTTLLDALCLALFGRTPRLDRVNASGNEIMTRGTKECLAEAVLELDGKRYCSVWSQKIGGRKGAVKLQAPKHIFSRLFPDETVLADKVTDVGKTVEELLRLDFDRFTRTVVLPQGGFAAFLQADGSSRAKLLEELTGAEVYRAVSREVFERTKREKAELEKIRLAKGERAVLPDEERTAAQARVAASEAREAALRAEGEKLRAAREWYARREALEKKLAELTRERDDNTAEREAFAPEGERLAVAERAATLSDLYDALKAAREKLKNAREDEAGAAEAVAAAETEAAKTEKEAAALAAAYEELRARAETNAETWERVAALDSELAGAQKELTEREEAAAERKQLLAEAEREERRLRDELERAEVRLPEAERAESVARNVLDEALNAVRRADLGELRARLIDGEPCPLCGSVHHPAPFAAQEEEKEVFRLHELAEEARIAAEAAQESLRRARDAQVRLTAELRAQTGACEAARAEWAEAEERARNCREAYEQKRDARVELFGEKDPAAERKQFGKDQSRSEKRANSAREAETAAKIALAQARAGLTQRSEQRTALEGELSEREAAFADRLKKLGFRAEDEWRDASLDEETREKLAAQRKRLEGRERELAALVPQAEAELAAHGEVPEQPEAGLDALIDENAAALTELLTARGADAEALARDAENRARLAELTEQEARQQKICDVWRDLNDHIGSASGDKFSRYVQGLTFRRLVRAANAQLERLSERYRLRAGEDDALRLDVIDLWHGGEVRSSKNLSGGESFIVSLALALALSHGMREVKVDSLFLDEGFGTLDDETLETVLDCLDRLRESGKLVGVISHVKQLQERIGCRIAVIPEGNGHSRLTGPGCVGGNV